MPGGPGYPGGLPTLTDGGRNGRSSASATGAARTSTRPRPTEAETPRPVVAGAGRVVSGLSVSAGAGPGGTAAVALATPDSYGEIVVVDLASGAETVLTTHGAGQAEVDLYAAAGAGVHDLRRHHRAGLADPRPRRGRARPAAARHPRRAAQRVERRRRPGAPLPPGARRARLDGAAAQPAGQRRLRRGVLHRRGRRLGRPPTRRTSSSPSTQLVAEGIADPARLAVTGYSYGGYMTCYLTSRDGRFAAAVAGGAVSDLTSMSGTSDEGNALAALGVRAAVPGRRRGPRSPRCRRSPGSPT